MECLVEMFNLISLLFFMMLELSVMELIIQLFFGVIYVVYLLILILVGVMCNIFIILVMCIKQFCRQFIVVFMIIGVVNDVLSLLIFMIIYWFYVSFDGIYY